MGWYDDAVEYWNTVGRRDENGSLGPEVTHRISTLGTLSRICGRESEPTTADVATLLYRFVSVPPTSPYHRVVRVIWDITTTPQLKHLPPYGASVVSVDPGATIEDVIDIASLATDRQTVVFAGTLWFLVGGRKKKISGKRLESITIGEYVRDVSPLIPVKVRKLSVEHIGRLRDLGFTDDDPMFPIGIMKYSKKKRPRAGMTLLSATLSRYYGVSVNRVIRSIMSYIGVPRGGKYRFWVSKPGYTHKDPTRSMLFGVARRYKDEIVIVGDVSDSGTAECFRFDGTCLEVRKSDLQYIDPKKDLTREDVLVAIENGVYVSDKLRSIMGVDSEQ